MISMECFEKHKYLSKVKMIGYNADNHEVVASQLSDTKFQEKLLSVGLSIG